MDKNDIYRITSVRYEDIPQCAETIRAAFLPNAEKYGFTKENYPSSGAFIEEETLVESKNNGVHMYAAWMGGKIVGFVQLAHPEKKLCLFQKFAVLPEYQHSGIGRRLIAFCKNKSRIIGAEKIKLIMVYDNEALRKFYESEGFVLVRTEEDEAHPFVQGIMEMDLYEEEKSI